MFTRRAFATAAVGPFFAFPATQRANLLFLCSDQHQTGASGCYGHSVVQTPHIDEIAADAVRFTGAYCQSPVCVPSRGSIITGLYPHQHGARILRDALSDDVPTVAHYFAERGYQTAAIGKMHFVDESRRHGFEYRFNEDSHAARLTDAERKLFRKDQGGAGGTTGAPSQLDERYFPDTAYADESIAYLRANRDRPFCLWSSFFMPHTPLTPVRRYWDLYENAAIELPERGPHELEEGFEGHLIRAHERGWYQQTDDELRQSIRGYYGNVSQMDSNVGRVFDALRELGLDRNTVVVYTSDHGEMAGAHRMWTKHNMFEESVSVPLLVRMPDRIESGKVREQLVEQVDLFPTL
ncbi:MAG: sulfatase-like hydrolase/transferase, partial [Acidobacteria bacterium]|nr:sulfatase-like hydrolase/transferase [Acidobacteriota bacterium]